MTLQEFKRRLKEFKRECGITRAKASEEEVNGEVKFVEVILRVKIDKNEEIA